MTASTHEAVAVILIYLAIVGPSLFVWYMLHSLRKLKKESDAKAHRQSRL